MSNGNDSCARCGHARHDHGRAIATGRCLPAFVRCDCMAFVKPEAHPLENTRAIALAEVPTVLLPPRPAERVASLYMRPDGRWHGDVVGPGKAFCATANKSLEAVVSFLVRRLLAAGTGICATGCEDRT